MALSRLDRAVMEWLKGSLAESQRKLEEAPLEQVARLQGECAVLRHIIETAENSEEYLSRRRANTVDHSRGLLA